MTALKQAVAPWRKSRCAACFCDKCAKLWIVSCMHSFPYNGKVSTFLLSNGNPFAQELLQSDTTGSDSEKDAAMSWSESPFWRNLFMLTPSRPNRHVENNHSDQNLAHLKKQQQQQQKPHWIWNRVWDGLLDCAKWADIAVDNKHDRRACCKVWMQSNFLQ